MRGRAALCAGLLAVAACGGEPASPAPGRWHVAGGFVRDPEGRAAILRGLNLSGTHKQSPYFGYQELPDYQRVRADWDMNALRFLVTWAAVEPARGEYDDAYLDELERRIGWAEQAGLLVVVDMHQDLYGEGFGGDGAPRWTCDEARYAAFEPVEPWFLNYQNENVIACYDALWASTDLRDHYAEAWRRVAARLVGHPAVIGFDVMNEPHWGSASVWDFEPELLAPFYAAVVAAVRSEAPDWLAFLEPSSLRNTGIATQLLPFDFGDVVYAPHSYDAGAERGQGFDPANRSAVLDNLAALAGEARSLNAALWIGEYGGVASQGGIADYMDAEYDGAAAVAAGSMYWHYGRDDGYGLLDPDGNEKSELVDTLVRPYPERVAGDPVAWSFDPETSRFSLTYEPDPDITAPTLLALPERVYPGGFQVECDGCVYQPNAAGVAITQPPAGHPARVDVTAAVR